ncbi:hypothetical protein A9995_00755 [Erythrobacter sp. QSSC1-22B]|uniref:hypothetical protein n=1 Tax=Erythrobacter sp. QSSC1-22B TaxID=1860125 RepID=UPI0008050E3F|nr:hypothetical protein [Erythrobacter sp. QSSC1-22B]OBX20295.1 hypothetical protein A9995_00755 [Erythrobacter sp. QSSC1-22B]
MSEKDNEIAIVRRLKEESEQLNAENKGLKKGGDGGTFDGMEARVNRLETRLDKTNDTLGDVRVDLSTLVERVAHLPSKGFIVTALGTGVLILGGITLAAERLKGLIGL